MKALIKLGSIFIMIIFSSHHAICYSQDNNSQDEMLKKDWEQTKKSFYDLMKQIEWGNFSAFEDEKNLVCKQDLMEKVKNFKTPDEYQTSTEFEAYEALHLFVNLQYSATNDSFLQNVDFSNFPFATYPKRAKILSFLTSSKTVEEFTEKVLNKAPHTSNDKFILEYIYSDYNKIKSGNVTASRNEYTIDNCNYVIYMGVRLKEMNLQKNKLIWEASIWQGKVKCDCNKEANGQELKSAEVIITVDFESEIVDNNFLKLNFNKFSPSKVRVLNYECCPKQENPEEDKSSKDDHGYYNPNNSEQECCAVATSPWYVGVYPSITLTNNFEDTHIGIGADIGYQVGSIFGENPFYVGLGASYVTGSFQNGDVTDNTFSGMAFAENWIKIAPCVNFTQKLYGSYGTGGVTSFENEYDSITVKGGVQLGFVFSLSESVSIKGQGDVFTLGSTEYQYEFGDTKEDIGTFSAPSSYSLGLLFNF
ncbi:MAG: hypothetical protein R2781_12400 [Flavobacteriaceae bacterium]